MDTIYSIPSGGNLAKRPFWYYVVDAFSKSSPAAAENQDAQIQEYYLQQSAATTQQDLLKWALIGGAVLTAIIVYKKVK